MSSGLSGYRLLGVATSLLEFVTMLTSIRLDASTRQSAKSSERTCSISEPIAVADVIYRGARILNASGRFEIIACLICLLQTGVHALNLIERQSRTFLRLGFDSIPVICLYLGELLILHFDA